MISLGKKYYDESDSWQLDYRTADGFVLLRRGGEERVEHFTRIRIERLSSGEESFWQSEFRMNDGYPRRQMPPKQPDSGEWLDMIKASDFRQRTGMNKVTAWRWEKRMVKYGKLHPKWLGRLKHYPASEIRAWFDAGGDAPASMPLQFVARAERVRRSSRSQVESHRVPS